MAKKIKKVVLAYSGGLDTSVILRWLIETYGCEVVTMTADLGQEDDLNGVDEKALKTGASKAYVEDLRPQKAAAVFRDVDCHSHVGRSGSGRRPVGFCKKCGKL